MAKKLKAVFIIILSSLLSACVGAIYTTHIVEPFYHNSNPFGEWREGTLRVISTKNELEAYMGKPDLKEDNENKWTYIDKNQSHNYIFIALLIPLPPISWNVEKNVVFYFQEEKILKYSYGNWKEKRYGGMCGLSGSSKVCWQ